MFSKKSRETSRCSLDKQRMRGGGPAGLCVPASQKDPESSLGGLVGKHRYLLAERYLDRNFKD